MRWIGFSGSWRNNTPKLEKDVLEQALKALKSGNGIVTGGAPGVDYCATEMAMNFDRSAARILIFLPTSLAEYGQHLKKRALRGVITQKTAEKLLKQLEQIRKANPAAIIENTGEHEVNNRTYYVRNSRIAATCDELLAFQVNGSLGTQNAIDEAHKFGKKVTIFSYNVKK